MNDRNRKIVIGILIVVVCGGLTAMLLKSEKPPQVNEPVEIVKLVKVQEVALDSQEVKISIQGRLMAAQKIELFAEVNGILQTEKFLTGTSFRRGEVIASIDAAEIRSSIKAQKSTLLNQTAKLLADLKFDFPDEVPVWDKFLEGIDFSKPLPALPNVTDAKLKKFLAGRSLFTTYFNIQSQEERLNKYTVNAPFDGVLTKANLKKGALVRAGQPMGEFIQTGNYELVADIAVEESNKVKVGDKVLLTSNDLNGSWNGEVARINPKVDENSQNVSFYISVAGDDLYDGMYLFGELNVGIVSEAMVINRGLVDRNEMYVVVDSTLQKKTVQLIQKRDAYAIVQGLENGELILNEPIKGAYPGMKVRYE